MAKYHNNEQLTNRMQEHVLLKLNGNVGQTVYDDLDTFSCVHELIDRSTVVCRCLHAQYKSVHIGDVLISTTKHVRKMWLANKRISNLPHDGTQVGIGRTSVNTDFVIFRFLQIV